MPVDVPPPTVDLSDRWQLQTDKTTTPFDTTIVTVRAHTRVFTDTKLSAAINVSESTQEDTTTTWRFVFASRLQLSRSTAMSDSILKLVRNRAASRFVDILDNRGFDSIRKTETRRFDRGDETMPIRRYRATVAPADDSAQTPVEAYVTTWAQPQDIIIGGGAYPLSVPNHVQFTHDQGRKELFDIIRSIE
ncbi:hypothetical protein [Haloquadratum walsbyi]|uniref:Uncharacterized protein n=1 Tax=Haloquadratum walsbyi (strain DSM 16790 / HBSQ001) TaxID=362976 RepID=Q18HM1_HALWD|nr:hypothetical protein [Haloquadratum walsbyi]CAJ52517.1 uncharacterized protein HQ_2397A [Haloquadratum walsbyi DSM 16790]